MATFHFTRKFGLILLMLLSFVLSVYAQPQIRITNKGQIEQVNMGNAVYIGLSAGSNTNPASTNNVFIGGQSGAANTSGYNSTGVGSNTLRINTTGFSNAAFGYAALEYNLTGRRNVSIGAFSLQNNNSANDNVAVGYQSMMNTTTGYENVAIGNYALENTISSGNTAIGIHAMRENVAGLGNVAVGRDALMNMTNAGGNVAVGNSALREVRNGNNVAVGTNAGVNDSISHQNVFIGGFAGANTFENIVSRHNNVMVGYDAGRNSNGNGNVFLGSLAGRDSNGSNRLYIDNTATSTPLIYGNFSTNKLEFNGLTELKAAPNFPALIWDNGNAVLKNSQDAILWKRPIFRILLDSDNNNSGVSGQAQFQLFSNVDTSAALTAKVNFNCDGGDSWISSGNVGIGLTNPAYKLDVAGVINASGLGGSNVVMRAQGAEAVWFDGTQFSWGFGGTWNRFADSVRIGGSTSPTHLLQVDGVARATQSTFATTSDARVKENVVTIENALGTISLFRPVTFEWIDAYKKEHPEAKEVNYGFISQEVEQIIPSMVTVVREKLGDQTIDDFRVLNTDALMPLLVSAVQEQMNIIDELRAREKIYQAALLSLEQRMLILESNVGSKE